MGHLWRDAKFTLFAISVGIYEQVSRTCQVGIYEQLKIMTLRWNVSLLYNSNCGTILGETSELRKNINYAWLVEIYTTNLTVLEHTIVKICCRIPGLEDFNTFESLRIYSSPRERVVLMQ